MAVRLRRRRVRRLALALTGGVVALAAGASAAPAAVTLDWTQAAVYDFASPTSQNHTWLGYATGAPPALANGSAAASDGATGETVTAASPHGADALYTFSYPAVSGSVNTTARTGTLDFEGTVSFISPAPPTGHGFTLTVEDPQIVLDGDEGLLYASGQGAGDNPTYDRTEALFTLDLTGTAWNLAADGTWTLSGIVPTLAETGYAFPGNYIGGVSGPDRTPNTFGGFAISVSPDVGPAGPQGPAGSEGPIGPAGPIGVTGPIGLAGPKGAQGQRGKRGVRGKRGPAGKAKQSQVARLAKAPFGKATRSVKLTRHGKVVASGTVRGRTLRVALRGKRLEGVYVLRPAAKATRTFAPLRVRIG